MPPPREQGRPAVGKLGAEVVAEAILARLGRRDPDVPVWPPHDVDAGDAFAHWAADGTP